MARREVVLNSRMPREWQFALLGLDNLPGRLVDDDAEKAFEKCRQRLMQALLKRHAHGDGIGDSLSRFVELLNPADWPRQRTDLAGSEVGCRTPADVAETWGLQWFADRLYVEERWQWQHGSRHAAAKNREAREAAERLIKLKSAAIGGCLADFGRDATGRPLKVNWAILDRAWTELETKLVRLSPVFILPVITIHAPCARKPKKRGKLRLVHNRDAAPPPASISPAPVDLVAADAGEGGTTGDGAA